MRYLLLLLALAGCTDRVVLGQRDVDNGEGDRDASSTFDATPPMVDAPIEEAEPDAEPEPELCTCCCPEGEGEGTCPEICGCEDVSDCPDGYECVIPDGSEERICVT